MSTNKRLKVKIGKRIVVGTYAFPLNQMEKKRYGSMTHRWVCLLRSPDDENMSHYIKRVQFDLDPSFLNPKRVITAVPYEINEVGWGEFYIGVKIYFVDESIEPVQLQHLLRLHTSDNAETMTNAVNETHDEIVFNEPNAWFYEKLLCSSNDKLPPSQYKEYFWNYENTEREALCRYVCCQSYFQNETYRLLSEATDLCKQIQELEERVQTATVKPPNIQGKDKTHNKLTNSPVNQSPMKTAQRTSAVANANKTDNSGARDHLEQSPGNNVASPKRQKNLQISPKLPRTDSKTVEAEVVVDVHGAPRHMGHLKPMTAAQPQQFAHVPYPHMQIPPPSQSQTSVANPTGLLQQFGYH